MSTSFRTSFAKSFAFRVTAAASLAAVVTLALIVSFTDRAGVNAAPMQNVMTGTWKASVVKDNSKINLNLARQTDKGDRHSHGQTYEFAELGLTREQVMTDGPARFSLVREAGTIDFEGNFASGKGSGTFRFTPSASFLSAMKSRGFDFEADSSTKHFNESIEDKLLTATVVNVTTALADDLNSAGFGKLDVGDLFKAAIFKIDSNFMREMKATGFSNLGMEDLVKARIFKIDADLVRRAAQMGFGKEPFENLVKMQIFKITPEYVTEIRNEGVATNSMEEIVKLRIFKIDADFIRKAKADGVSIDVETLVQRRLGITPHARSRSRQQVL